MNKTPLMIFSGLAVAAAVAVGGAGLYLEKTAQTKPVVFEQPKIVELPVAKAPEPQVAIIAPKAVEAPKTVEVVSPTFDTVRVSPTGDAVIAGRAAANTEVSAMLNGQVVASATTNAAGEFVMVPAKPMPEGTGVLTLEVKNNGVVKTSEQSVAVSVKPQAKGETTVAVLAPGLPTKVIEAPKPVESIALDAVDYDAAGNIIFSGRAKANDAVRIYVDNAPAGEAKSDATGKWVFKGQATVPSGTHILRADEVAVDGAVVSRVELPFLREEPAKVAVVETPTPVVETVKAPEVPQPKRITVQPGNNLWKISREIYGAGKSYTVIYEANKDQIRNPRLIYPGQIITAPVKAQ
jgi:nucleoid-associated protein YgaU